MKYFLILSVMVFSVLKTSAQNCNVVLYGTIKQGNTKTVLPGTNIAIEGKNTYAIADSEGHFHFNKLCPGKYILKVSYLGFTDKTIEIDLEKSKEIEISLFENSNQLLEVNVIASTKSLEALQQKTTISEKELTLNKGNSLGEILKNIPGLNSIQTGPTISKPVIHGMHSNRVVIYNSGVRTEGQQWGTEHAPEIDPFQANNINVIKGASSIEYGPDGIGGVILVEQNPLNYHEKFSGEVGIVGATNNRMSAINTRLEGANKVENLAWRVQASAKKAGNAKTPNYYLNNTGFDELNGTFNLAYKAKTIETDLQISTFNTTIGIFEGAHIGSLDDLNERILAGRPYEDGSFSYKIDVPRQEVNHHTIKLGAKKYFNNKSKLSASYSFQQNHRQEYDLRRGGKSSIAALDLKLNTQTLDAVFQSNLNNEFIYKIGINATSIVNNNIPGTFVTPLIPNYDNLNAGLFLINQYTKEKYQLELGLRYDYKHLDALGYNSSGNLYGAIHNFHNFSGSAGANFKLNNILNFKSNVGLSWRPPTVNELYSNGLHHGSAAIEIGNENLNSEKGYKWINTLSANTTKFNAEISGYINLIDNYIFLNPTGTVEETSRGAFPIFNYQQTNASFIGADLSTKFEFAKNMNWQFKGAIIKAKDKESDTYLPLIPTNRLQNAIEWAKPLANKKFDEPFVKIEHVFVDKQRRYTQNSDFASPPAAYHLFNISGGFNYNIQKQQFNISATAYNVFNKEYKDYLNRLRYFAHETGRNITLRITYKF